MPIIMLMFVERIASKQQIIDTFKDNIKLLFESYAKNMKYL